VFSIEIVQSTKFYVDTYVIPLYKLLLSTLLEKIALYFPEISYKQTCKQLFYQNLVCCHPPPENVVNGFSTYSNPKTFIIGYL
jgi:hypothetical protein